MVDLIGKLFWSSAFLCLYRWWYLRTIASNIRSSLLKGTTIFANLGDPDKTAFGCFCACVFCLWKAFLLSSHLLIAYCRWIICKPQQRSNPLRAFLLLLIRHTSLSAFSFPAIPWWFLSIVTMTVNLIKPQAILLGKATIFSKLEAVFNIFQDSGKPLT